MLVCCITTNSSATTLMPCALTMSPAQSPSTLWEGEGTATGIVALTSPQQHRTPTAQHSCGTLNDKLGSSTCCRLGNHRLSDMPAGKLGSNEQSRHQADHRGHHKPHQDSLGTEASNHHSLCAGHCLSADMSTTAATAARALTPAPSRPP